MDVEPTPAQLREAAMAAETAENWPEAGKSWRAAVVARSADPSTPLRDADLIEWLARAVAAEKHEPGTVAAAMHAEGKDPGDAYVLPETEVGANLDTGAR
jgi:hypothetical protein